MASPHNYFSLLLFGTLTQTPSFVREWNGRLHFYFILFFFFIFILNILHFSIFRTLVLGLEVIGHTVTSVTSDGVVTTLITRLERRK